MFTVSTNMRQFGGMILVPTQMFVADNEMLLPGFAKYKSIRRKIQYFLLVFTCVSSSPMRTSGIRTPKCISVRLLLVLSDDEQDLENMFSGLIPCWRIAIHAGWAYA